MPITQMEADPQQPPGRRVTHAQKPESRPTRPIGDPSTQLSPVARLGVYILQVGTAE